MAESQLSSETYATIDHIVRIANLAVAKAQQESRRMGVPNVYSINGRIYYETPAGGLSASDPFADGKQATKQTDEREPD
jgi:hypothetical protein